MKIFGALILAGGFLCIVNACEPNVTSRNSGTPIDLDALKIEIQELEWRLAAAENSKDIDGALRFYSKNIISYAPKSPPTVGLEAILNRMQRNIDADTTNNEISFTTQEVYAAGEIVTEVGQWIYATPDSIELSRGPYISVFKKEHGQYRCIREIYNAGVPPKAD